ncbi:uncharacterized protein LAESUDRAFT_764585 [Laetiporus sulphureus 93-53]|uniref:Uncharacterized protein n=1 Tax=Laetiporus sulphureus 93-53 TaxID=1314785 RepID=A0A165B7W4_9APHY|nr:uncharacterized protein LAESUDRAFT_764585 [Laetiporus sulphureus 93-53]KZT00447.1 hypothetical protein LAESUDRAFT_764585 [Laetiporus sulphureus 93-53]
MRRLCILAPSAAHYLAGSAQLTSTSTHAGDGGPVAATPQEEGRWKDIVGGVPRHFPLICTIQRHLPTSKTRARAHAKHRTSVLYGSPFFSPFFSDQEPTRACFTITASLPQRGELITQACPIRRPLPRLIFTAHERADARKRWRPGDGDTTGGGRVGACTYLPDVSPSFDHPAPSADFALVGRRVRSMIQLPSVDTYGFNPSQADFAYGVVDDSHGQHGHAMYGVASGRSVRPSMSASSLSTSSSAANTPGGDGFGAGAGEADISRFAVGALAWTEVSLTLVPLCARRSLPFSPDFGFVQMNEHLSQYVKTPGDLLLHQELFETKQCPQKAERLVASLNQPSSSLAATCCGSDNSPSSASNGSPRERPEAACDEADARFCIIQASSRMHGGELNHYLSTVEVHSTDVRMKLSHLIADESRQLVLVQPLLPPSQSFSSFASSMLKPAPGRTTFIHHANMSTAVFPTLPPPLMPNPNSAPA